MKKIVTLIVVLISFSLSAQVLCSRSAPLVNNGYSIKGTAYLEKYGTDSLKLRLSADYTTPSGPDVRVYLSKSETFNSSAVVEIVNLATNGQFSGAHTFDVPKGVTMEQYPYVLFYCFEYSQPWAKGSFSVISGSCTPTSIWGEVSNSELTVYPNPTSGELNLGLTAQNIEVYTTEGVLVAKAESSNKIDLSLLSKNTYVVIFDGYRKMVTVL